MRERISNVIGAFPEKREPVWLGVRQRAQEGSVAEKIAVFAPMASANVPIATQANTGFFSSIRTA
jgi:hypothetical protein